MKSGFDYDADGARIAPDTYQEKCAKCGGTGSYQRLGKCFACKGVGFKTYRSSPEARRKARESRQARIEKLEQECLAAFAAKHPAEFAWMEAARERFGFARSLHDAVRKFGDLTEKQLIALQGCMTRDAERQAAKEAERAAREASAPAVETSRLMAAFDAAKAAGLKRVSMRFDGFKAMPAPETSRNAGAIYLKAGDVYLGKIVGGRLQTTAFCPPETAAKIVAAMNDPLSEAIAYGKATGRCSICSRELTDPESIARGIGPICASNFSL